MAVHSAEQALVCTCRITFIRMLGAIFCRFSNVEKPRINKRNCRQVTGEQYLSALCHGSGFRIVVPSVRAELLCPELPIPTPFSKKTARLWCTSTICDLPCGLPHHHFFYIQVEPMSLEIEPTGCYLIAPTLHVLGVFWVRPLKSLFQHLAHNSKPPSPLFCLMPVDL